VQILGDGGELGPLLAAHPGIDKVAFTGSTTTGRSVMAAAAATLKRQTLELGGNDAAIVLEDADPRESAERIFAAAFGNSGQVCGAIKRVYAQDGVYQPLCDHLADLLASCVVGDGLDSRTTLGPVQNQRQFARAEALQANASRDGRVVAEGRRPDGPGFFIAPGLYADLPETHPLVAEEQFAPLLPIQRFCEVAEAVQLANGSQYGLTASVWSIDARRAEEVALQLDASLVCINRHNENPVGLGLSMAKQSGMGWLLGEEGVKEYLQPHLVIR